MSFPLEALVGGLLIGASAALLLLGSGKVAGISGVMKGILSPRAHDQIWRVLFLISLVIGAAFGSYAFNGYLPDAYPASTGIIITAAILVGIGTNLGNGCTSGHGIVGVGRLSKRSLVATVTFMLTAIITVFITHHII
ncbi:YeeE/YedE thiosulfate transporter family protein [Vibrio sp.]|nr:YeeE/YedE thiosulfate transporter family protein [Vibrio sp.]